MSDRKDANQARTEADARAAAVQAQATQSAPDRRVPTSGPLVEGPAYGQHPYTDPPPMARRRFYEDPRPLSEATEEMVLQGRGAIPPYPADQTVSRAWDPRRYPDQAGAMRPADSPQPSEWEANASLTLAQFLAMPREQQDRILEQAREQQSIGRVPEYRPTSEYLAEEDRKAEESARIHKEALATRAAAFTSAGVPQMAPAHPGTHIAGERGEETAKPPAPKHEGPKVGEQPKK